MQKSPKFFNQSEQAVRYHSNKYQMILIYEKHPHFACIYTESFVLIRVSSALIREVSRLFALIFFSLRK